MQEGIFDPLEVHAGFLHLEALGNDLMELTTQRRELENRVAAKQRDLVEAMRKRQALEKLRDNQLKAYKKNIERLELQTMEEAVLPRLARRQAAERARIEQTLQNKGE